PDNPATPTNERAGPPQATDVVATTRLSAEPFVHFLECPRVISARGRFYIFHGVTVSAFARGVKGIPILIKISPSWNRHGKSPPFAMLNQTHADFVPPAKSCFLGFGRKRPIVYQCTSSRLEGFS